MLPLLFILCITGLSIVVAYRFSSEVTWFTYYLGGIIGLFISSVILEFWTRRRRKKEQK